MKKDLLPKGVHKEKYALFLNALKQARLDMSLTQNEVAKILGRSQDWVSRCEGGEHRVDIVELAIFSKIYHKDFSYFLSIVDGGMKNGT